MQQGARPRNPLRAAEGSNRGQKHCKYRERCETGALKRRECSAMGEGRTVYLFSYGTLQQEGVQMSSFGRLLQGADDALPGYRQSTIEIADPEVVRKSGKRFHPIVA